jgi:hypothetical protein
MSSKNNQSSNPAGKGDKPRNCFSKAFKENYDEIDWNHHKKQKSQTSRCKSIKVQSIAR